MTVNRKHLAGLTALALAACIAGCVAGPGDADVAQLTDEVVQASFRAQGQATLDRLTQDETNRACSAAAVAGQPLDEATARAVEQANFKTIRWPADGKFLGDWREGEKIAQSGRGMTWSDKPGSANGGNCYNCHQISQQEISYGTLGPSLYHYGRLRGVANPDAPEARPVLEYTWGKIWNAKAYNACSLMPRAGHAGVLTEQQVRHIMALLLDPKSPVNQ